MKRKGKILASLVSVMVAASVTATVIPAFADEATADREFDSRLDTVFEDFDRDDISDTVTVYDEDGVDTGEKPYLHVNFSALSEDASATTRVAQIYKQGTGSIQNVATRGQTITIRMRAPEGGVSISDLNFGVRSPNDDSDADVVGKGFDELYDEESQPMPELTTEWQDYNISFATSYESDDVYPGTGTAVTDDDLAGIHIWADAGVSGTIDISYIMYNGTSYMNNFTGGDTAEETAKAASSSTWWAGSSYGSVIKRTVTTTGGEFSVVKSSGVSGYKYAVIETEGDTSGLTVQTTTDGETWSDPVAYDGYSVALNGDELGFRFGYTGQSSVSVKEIWLTSLEEVVPDTVTPLIDATSVQLLDDFSVSQSGFTDDYEEAITAPELSEANMEYRLSYNNGDKVEIDDGYLIFESAGEGYINFKFKSNGYVTGDYLVLKVWSEVALGSSLGIAIIDMDATSSSTIYSGSWKAGVQLSSPLNNSSNPYATEDGWYYIVVDIAETGYSTATGYSGLDMYWRGSGELYVDEIFFAEEIEDFDGYVVEDVAYPDISVDVEATSDWNSDDIYVDNSANNGTILAFDITPASDDFSISNLRLEFADADGTSLGIFWASSNVQGTLYTTSGLTLDQLTYTAGEATHVEINLSTSGISGAFSKITIHRHDIGAFTIDNVSLQTVTVDTDAYKEQMELFDSYLDNVAPSVTINMDTTAKPGDTITVDYTVSDNATAVEDLSVTVSVIKDGESVAVDENNSFVAEEGVYTITVTARDTSGNEGSDVIQVTVSDEVVTDPDDGDVTDPDEDGDTDTTDPDEDGDTDTIDPDEDGDPDVSEDEESDGLSTGAIVGIVIAVVVVVAVIIIVSVVLAKRKNSKN